MSPMLNRRFPTYDPQVGLPAFSAPNIPTSMGTSVAEATAKAGAQIFGEAMKFSEAMQKSEIASSVSRAIGEASRKLFDSRLSFMATPDFNMDPATSVQKWSQQAGNIRSEMLSQFTDDKAKEVFNNQFEQLYTHNYQTLGQQAQVQRVRISGGEFGSAVDNLVHTMSRGNDSDFERGLKGIDVVGGGAVASGVVHPDAWARFRDQKIQQAATDNLRNQVEADPQGVLDKIAANQGPAAWINDVGPLRTHAEARLNQLHERQKQLAEDFAYKYTFGQFRLADPEATIEDFHRAYGFVMDPANSDTLGIPTLEARTKVANAIIGDGNRIFQERKRLQDTADENFMSGVYDGKIPGASFSTYVDPATNLSPSSTAKGKAIGAINTDQRRLDQTDNAVWNDTWQKVNNDEITDTSMLPAAGEGLSRADVKSFSSLLQTKKDKWFNIAVKSYDNRYRDEFLDLSEASEHRIAFLTGLDQAIKKDSLKGPAILEAANAMMKEQDGLLGKIKSGTSSRQIPSSGPLRRPLPPPVQNRSGEAEIVGTHTQTGQPIYRLQDGTLAMDPPKNAQVPEVVGVHKDTGQAVYRMPDGSYVTSETDDTDEGGDE